VKQCRVAFGSKLTSLPGLVLCTELLQLPILYMLLGNNVVSIVTKCFATQWWQTLTDKSRFY